MGEACGGTAELMETWGDGLGPRGEHAIYPRGVVGGGDTHIDREGKRNERSRCSLVLNCYARYLQT